jgi:vancomycin resistance protein YoaR
LSGASPYQVSFTPVASEPRFTNEQVAAVAAEANQVTAEPVEVRVLDQRAEVGPEILRDWIRLDSSGNEPTWTIDAEQALKDLKPLFPALGSDDQRARFNLVDGVPTIIPASETIVCCTAESVGGIKTALLDPNLVPATDGKTNDAKLRQVELKAETVGSDEGVTELQSLGIVEEVSSFTTKHPCCATRVTNIHRFADLMRGAIIRPGEDFSLNEHVGQRTLAKGFVADHAIVNGVLEDQVGGGVSQFATTFFNASFFAGLDFNEYQSHSLYISRYPKGREATISWRRPDLSVKNTTPYGILVWTSYTDTSITVTFYSTKYVEVEAGDLIASPQVKCTRYTTPRTRTYPDGHVVKDSVFAVYRPGEGFDCNGNPTTPPSSPEGPTMAAGQSEPVVPGAGQTPALPPAPRPGSVEPAPSDPPPAPFAG